MAVRQTRRVRVGVVGSDIIHALEYASVFRPEPGSNEAMLSVPPLRPGMEAKLAEVRALPAQPPPTPWTREALEADPAVAAFEVVGWWGQDRAQTDQMAGRLGVEVTDRLEDLVTDVDAALVCTYDAKTHHDLAMPFLEAGRHVFVDKPFADRVDQAEAMIDAAERRGVVLFSSSPWKWAPAVREVLSHLPELDGVRSAVATGPIVDGRFFYTSHSVELMQMVLGDGARTVTAHWTPTNYAIMVEYVDGRIGVVNGLRDIAWLRHLAVHGQRGYLEADVTNPQRDEGKIQMLVEFARAIGRGQPPVPHSWLREAVAVMCAAEHSARNGGEPTPLAGPR